MLDPETCPPQLDLAFLLDTSGSVDKIYEEQIKWTKAIINSLPVHQDAVRVALLQYATIPLVEFSLDSNNDKREAIKKVDLIEFHSGVTKTGDALRQTELELFSPLKGARVNASKIIVLFTDGLSIDSPSEPSNRLRDVRGVNIYVISVGTDGFVPEMQKIAGDVENVFGPTDLSRFNEHLMLDVEAARKCPSDMEETIDSNYDKTTLAPIQTITDKQKKKFRIMRRQGDKGTIVKEEIITNANGKKIRRVIRRKARILQTSTTTPTTLPPTEITQPSPAVSEITTRRKKVKALGKKTTAPTLTQPITTATSVPPAIPLTTTRRSIRTPASTTPAAKSMRITTTAKSTTKLFHTKKPRVFSSKNRVIDDKLDCPLDILFVVDSSGSVGSVYEKQKNFLSSILENVELDEQSHRVAFIQFAGARLQKMEREFASFKHNEELMSVFNSLRHFTGTTYIGAALEMASIQLESRRRDIPTIVIILSDGFSHDDVREQASKIRGEKNVEVFVASVAQISNIPTLLEIAGDASHLFIGDEAEFLKGGLLDRLRCQN